ncbi:glycosyltransferase [Oricola sp.]|uniref:glycosyltransferase family 2 protein n=1 Tax=Oricola sp. TaxID=1979950 RepID=UPI0025D267B3|nr:glycosyltransferase [Oricola sp.]MCI5078612.1 glycosyltransferase [Oricola sp.]
MPLFSVIVPCWNAEDTLEATLSSVERQSFPDFEVVVMDDGSTDATAAIAARFAARDCRFKLITLEQGGPSNARNVAAFSYAKGQVLAFLDADDLWVENKLLRMAELFCRSDAPDALYGRIGFFRAGSGTFEESSVRTYSTVKTEALTPGDLLRENAVCTMSNVVVHADAFKASGGFDTTLRYGEDVEWMVRLIADGRRIEGLDEVLVYYRTSDSGLSANLAAMHEGWSKTLETVRRADPALGPREVAAAEAVHLRYLARRALRVRASRRAAFDLVLAALAKSPRGFFSDPRRGGLTLLAAIADLVMPRSLRKFAAMH